MSLLPWQDALVALRSPVGEVNAGAWSWRKLILTDLEGMSSLELGKLLASLSSLGEEFCIHAYRPQAAPNRTGGPANYRVALVTWGAYLGLTIEDIYDRMNGEFGEVLSDSVGSEGSAEVEGRSSTVTSIAGGVRRPEPPWPRQGL